MALVPSVVVLLAEIVLPATESKGGKMERRCRVMYPTVWQKGTEKSWWLRDTDMAHQASQTQKNDLFIFLAEIY